MNQNVCVLKKVVRFVVKMKKEKECFDFVDKKICRVCNCEIDKCECENKQEKRSFKWQE